MEARGLDQLVVSSTSSIFYLTGKWIDPGERFLVLYLNASGVRKLFVNALFPVDEDPDLVELLLALDSGFQIPENLYVAVAEVLSFVYRMNGAAAPSEGKS